MHSNHQSRVPGTQSSLDFVVFQDLWYCMYMQYVCVCVHACASMYMCVCTHVSRPKECVADPELESQVVSHLTQVLRSHSVFCSPLEPSPQAPDFVAFGTELSFKFLLVQKKKNLGPFKYTRGGILNEHSVT